MHLGPRAYGNIELFSLEWSVDSCSPVKNDGRCSKRSRRIAEPRLLLVWLEEKSHQQSQGRRLHTELD